MKVIFYFLAFLFGTLAQAAYAGEDFNLWLADLKQEAIHLGVSQPVANKAVAKIRHLPKLIKLDRAQPEFVTSFLNYYQQRISALKVMQGRKLLVQHAELLNKVEVQYGVPKSLLVAFWGMETDYGRNQGDIDTLSALATLAYDGRRAEFFRGQLLDAILMLDRGDVALENFSGSWAGAFGHVQFMPTTFVTYAIDGDADNKIDIVNSKADAFSSAANYLSQVGWRTGEPVMIEVKLPQNFEWKNAQYYLRKPVSEWASLGVVAIQYNRELAKKDDDPAVKADRSHSNVPDDKQDYLTENSMSLADALLKLNLGLS